MFIPRLISWPRLPWLSAAFALICAIALARAAEPQVLVKQRFEQGGLVLDATISRTLSGAREGPLRSGEPVAVRFKVSDQAGKPVPGAFPNGWMVLRGPPSNSIADNADGWCRLVLRRLQTTSLPNQAEVDLNTFLVITLNEDATISVIDPRMAFGGTRLVGLVPLTGVGEDWVQLADHERLVVTVPDADAVDIVDMRTWNAPIRRLTIGGKPRRVALQPDRTFFWVDTVHTETGAPNVVAVDAETLAVAARIPIGEGPHDFAFTNDSRFLLVANAGSGTVSAINIANLALAAEIATGPRPISVAYSELANAAYVADAANGSVTVLDGLSLAVRTRIVGAPGVAQIGFAPGGRYGFVVNELASTITVIDSASDRAIQTVKATFAPDQVAFTSTMAFVRQRTSATVLMLPLNKVTAEEGKLPVFEFPAGSAPLAAIGRGSPAPAIVSVRGEPAVLVANASDREIYYYQEGLASPMASYSNYKRQPRAVMVARRDLRESEPGVYETSARLGRPGGYVLVFRLNQPPLYSCFSFDVEPALQATQPLRVAPAGSVVAVPAGRSVNLDFIVTNMTTGRPVDDLTDLTVLVMTPTWQARQVATPIGDGHYSASFTVPVPGFYAVLVRSGNGGIEFQTMPGLAVTAAP
jgi:YVTN family beta-propeller protein